jgi:hypothetical protein
MDLLEQALTRKQSWSHWSRESLNHELTNANS